MNGLVMSGSQGTEGWRHMPRMRVLMGKCGEVSCWGEQPVMGTAGDKEVDEGPLSLRRA